MTLYPTAASLSVYHPGASDPHLVINGAEDEGDFAGADVSSRIQEWIDTASFDLYNHHGDYSGEITHGDKLVFEWTTRSGTRLTDARYGHTRYGYARAGGHAGYETDSWTGMVTGTLTHTQHGGGQLTTSVEAADFVFAVLGSRLVYDSFEDRQVAGTADSIVNTVVADEAPEIDLDGVATVDQALDTFADGTNLLEFLVEIARESDSILAADGESLIFKPMSDVTPEFELRTEHFGTGETRATDDGLRNDIRVDGGTDYDLDEAQTTQDAYQTVTESNRLTYQLTTRKAQLDRVEVWTRPTGSEEAVTVRLQKDSGGAPVAPDDTQSDLVNKQLAHHFLADGDFTTFLLGEHTLPEPAPWLIIESGGTDGQDIGIDSATGNPTFRSHYQFPVAVKVNEPDSVRQFRRREDAIQKENISTMGAARSIGDAALAHDSRPERELSVDAQSPRAHRLRPGEVVATEFPRLTVDGEYIVTERSDTYAGSTLETDLTLQEVASF